MRQTLITFAVRLKACAGLLSLLLVACVCPPLDPGSVSAAAAARMEHRQTARAQRIDGFASALSWPTRAAPMAGPADKHFASSDA